MSDIMRLPAGTNEFLQVRVREDRDASNPTTATVDFALIGKNATPVGGDWLAGSWVAGGPPYYAQKKYLGTAGLWRLWIRVTTGSETIIRPVGLVEYYTEV